MSPLKPANEVNLAVDAELAAILDRAMAQNPDERYRSAAEFREALRRVGRVDDVPEVELIVHHAPIEATVVEIVETGDTTLVASSVRMRAPSRLGSHAIAAVFVIMLLAFGVFCAYYPWKLPMPVCAEISAHQLPVLSESMIQGARIGTTAVRKARP